MCFEDCFSTLFDWRCVWILEMHMVFLFMLTFVLVTIWLSSTAPLMYCEHTDTQTHTNSTYDTYDVGFVVYELTYVSCTAVADIISEVHDKPIWRLRITGIVTTGLGFSRCNKNHWRVPKWNPIPDIYFIEHWYKRGGQVLNGAQRCVLPPATAVGEMSSRLRAATSARSHP